MIDTAKTAGRAPAESEAVTEKNSAATNSVIAALGLTVFKIVVGLATGSLGILAEAAHSGFDLVAAVMTALAVRFSGKPADREHLYGHGKIENLSALFETPAFASNVFLDPLGGDSPHSLGQV